MPKLVTPTEATTKDVRDALERLIRQAPAGGIFNRVDTVNIHDDHTLFLRLGSRDDWFKVRVTF
jgi:MarR-like DNA-binding transcriptional regulator SgrR of sgrS sRNA